MDLLPSKPQKTADLGRRFELLPFPARPPPSRRGLSEQAAGDGAQPSCGLLQTPILTARCSPRPLSLPLLSAKCGLSRPVSLEWVSHQSQAAGQFWRLQGPKGQPVGTRIQEPV